MECPNCHALNREGNKYCSNCGTKLEAPAVNDETVVVAETEAPTVNAADDSLESALKDSMDQMKEFQKENFPAEEPEEEPAVIPAVQESEPEPEEAPAKPEESQDENRQLPPDQWYYSANGITMGPVSQDDMIACLNNGTILPTTYVWRTRMNEWKMLKDTELAAYIPQAAVNEDEWYFAKNGQSYGPFSRDEIISRIRSNSIASNDYLWKEGMLDWTPAAQTEFAPFFSSKRTTAGPVGNGLYGAPRVQQRQVFLYLLLSVLTCGIFYLYWMYALASDINTLAVQNNKPKGPDPLLAVLLSIFTCSFYGFYFYWKEGSVIASLDLGGYRPADNSVLYLILAIVGLPVVALAIMQDQVNTIVAREG